MIHAASWPPQNFFLVAAIVIVYIAILGENRPETGEDPP
jgi:hypothetical protein